MVNQEDSLLNTLDAKVWAKEFCKVFPHVPEEDVMVWFANAIVTGWDHRGYKK